MKLWLLIHFSHIPTLLPFSNYFCDIRFVLLCNSVFQQASRIGQARPLRSGGVWKKSHPFTVLPVLSLTTALGPVDDSSPPTHVVVCVESLSSAISVCLSGSVCVSPTHSLPLTHPHSLTTLSVTLPLTCTFCVLCVCVCVSQCVCVWVFTLYSLFSTPVDDDALGPRPFPHTVCVCRVSVSACVCLTLRVSVTLHTPHSTFYTPVVCDTCPPSLIVSIVWQVRGLIQCVVTFSPFEGKSLVMAVANHQGHSPWW